MKNSNNFICSLCVTEKTIGCVCFADISTGEVSATASTGGEGSCHDELIKRAVPFFSARDSGQSAALDLQESCAAFIQEQLSAAYASCLRRRMRFDAGAAARPCWRSLRERRLEAAWISRIKPLMHSRARRAASAISKRTQQHRSGTHDRAVNLYSEGAIYAA